MLRGEGKPVQRLHQEHRRQPSSARHHRPPQRARHRRQRAKPRRPEPRQQRPPEQKEHRHLGRYRHRPEQPDRLRRKPRRLPTQGAEAGVEGMAPRDQARHQQQAAELRNGEQRPQPAVPRGSAAEPDIGVRSGRRKQGHGYGREREQSRIQPEDDEGRVRRLDRPSGQRGPGDKGRRAGAAYHAVIEAAASARPVRTPHRGRAHRQGVGQRADRSGRRVLRQPDQQQRQHRRTPRRDHAIAEPKCRAREEQHREH